MKYLLLLIISVFLPVHSLANTWDPFYEFSQDGTCKFGGTWLYSHDAGPALTSYDGTPANAASWCANYYQKKGGGTSCGLWNTSRAKNEQWILNGATTANCNGQVCTSFNYGAWGVCQPNGTQTRSVISQGPPACTGGTPVTTQSCTPAAPLCTDYEYTPWSDCIDGNQTRSVTASLPQGCSGTGSSPITSRACTPPPPPEHCSNGIADLDMDETGTDCGPACGSECVAKCADGDELVYGLFDGYYQQMCYRLSPQDSQGKCPTLYSEMNNECAFRYSPANTKAETPPDPETMSTPPPFQTLGQTYAESGSSTNSTSSDGSTSSTSSTGSIGGGGGGGGGGSITSTTTTTTTTDPVTGDQTKEETEEVSVSPPLKYPQNFNADVGDQSRFTERFSEFTLNVRNAPFYSSFSEIFNPPTQGGISTHTLTMGAYGQESINLADYESVWSAIKLILTFASMFVAARLIMANK